MKTNLQLATALLLTTFLFAEPVMAQQEGRGNSEARSKGRNHQKEHPKDNPGKGHGKGKENDVAQGQGKGNARKNQPPGKEKGKHDKTSQHDDTQDRNKADGKGKETLGKQKITICHKPARKNSPGVTLTISERAWKTHQAHGDSRGVCPEIATGAQPVTIAEPVLKKRTDFYEQVTKSEEKIYDADDVLEAARERLRKARQRLEEARKAGKLPQPEIEKQETTIAKTGLLMQDLEQLIKETRRKIEADVKRVEANMAAEK